LIASILIFDRDLSDSIRFRPAKGEVKKPTNHGTVWNLSLTGWRFSGNLPLRIGEVCSLTVNLSSHPRLYVAAGIVRWVRGEEYGVETLVMDDESREEMEQYICQRVEDKWIAIHEQRTARLRNQEVDRDF